MDPGKTPMAGFRNGTREFGVFNLMKPVARTRRRLRRGMTCDATLGYYGSDVVRGIAHAWLSRRHRNAERST
jgi:hypothetical protein